MYRTLDVCNETVIRLDVKPVQGDGLIFYIGPESVVPSLLPIQGTYLMRLMSIFGQESPRFPKFDVGENFPSWRNSIRNLMLGENKFF